MGGTWEGNGGTVEEKQEEGLGVSVNGDLSFSHTCIETNTTTVAG